MGITGLTAFEELRFILEMIVAELIMLIPFVPKKKNFIPKVILLFVIYMSAAFIYFAVIKIPAAPVVREYLACGWYILFAISTVFFCKSLFVIGLVDSLYVIVASFAIQHIVYIIIHEALALYYWTFLVSHLLVYIVITIFCVAIVYSIFYKIFPSKLRECNGKLYEDNQFLVLFYVVVLAIMMGSTFSAQHLFRLGEEVRDSGIIWGLSTCVMILGIQYANFKSVVASKEQAIISRMLQDSASHYAISKELIDLVNRNAHDMKHKLRALKDSPEELKDSFINEQMSHIAEYQNLVFCDNEVLNTILAEKSLYCNSTGITFSCSVKRANLDFIDVVDLYALLGNAIDNAIECVSKFSDKSKRVISVNVTSKDAFTIIQVENYSDAIENTIDALPVTTKTSIGHGFGLKSIKFISKKYNGNMYWAIRDGVFSLQVMFPVPIMPS
ncbi:MAG: GHKL domain-containing protein [Pseudobutyrivibrio sp.]|nr:GHKL domain-containing protein [Pseudobutyrivibrio sp.]